METNDLLKKIKRIEITTKGLSKQLFSGYYQSAFKGSGMTFSEVRNYAYGDEVRTIDWNVTARYNEPHIKVFEEEKELTVLLMIDLSGSSNFGTSATKKNLAIEIAAVLVFTAAQNNDKIGAIIYTDKVEQYIPPKKGKKHAYAIINACVNFTQTAEETNLSEAIKHLQSVQKKRAITFIISDFIDDSNYLEKLPFLHKKHDIVAIKTRDSGEVTLPDFGYIELFNAESSLKTWVNSSDQKVIDYLAKKEVESTKKWKNSLLKLGIDSIVCSTDQAFIPSLVQLFKKRKK